MKKIIFTVTNDLTYDQRMQKICSSLSHAGYAVELVGRKRKTSIALLRQTFEQTRLECIFNKGKIFYIEYNLRLLLFLTFSDFDAACAIDLDTIVPVYLIAKLKGAKIAYDAHEYFTEVPEVIDRPVVKKIWTWIEKTFVPKFDLTYTVSPGLAHLFQKKLRKPFHIIMNVPELDTRRKTDTRLEKPEITDCHLIVANCQLPTILYQGALNEGRGLEQLITVMPQLNCTLKLAGEGDLSDEFRSLVMELKLQDKVEFLGLLTPDKLKQVTAAAAVGINLLENQGLNYYYSLANKFFDYIHGGIPQVCIDFPEYRRINEQYKVAILIKDSSHYEIKAAVDCLFADKMLYAQLQKNCEVCARDMNWQNEEVKLFKLYGRLLG